MFQLSLSFAMESIIYVLTHLCSILIILLLLLFNGFDDLYIGTPHTFFVAVLM